MWIQQEEARILALWDAYIRPLGPKPYNQFVKATKNPSNEMVRRFIWPHLFLGGEYICIADRDNVLGRNHLEAAKWYDLAYRHTRDDFELWQQNYSYFTNTLAVGTQDADGQWTRPMDRVYGGYPYTFTVEFDEKDTGFFLRQLSWLRSSKKPLDAPIGRVYRRLAEYRDFMGLTVNWSGHKSLHINPVFDTSLAVQLYRLDRTDMRDGLAAHWWNVEAIVREELDIPADVKADESLQWSEAFRRLPNGCRTVEKYRKKPDADGNKVPFEHMLGIPAGTKVPQIVLWEQWRTNKPDGAPLFFAANPFYATRSTGRAAKAKGIGGAISMGSLTPAEHAYCEAKLHELYPANPECVRLTHDGRRWVAYFRNSANDGSPSSIMREDFNRVCLMGRDSDKAHAAPLPYPLGAMLKMWVWQMKRPPAAAPIHKDETVWLDNIRHRPLTALEQWFQERAIDKVTAAGALRSALLRSVAGHELVWVKGPEGGGKSTGLFKVHHKLAAALSGDGGYAMYAFGNYDEAKAKADSFNAIQDARFHGAVITSWKLEYEEACNTVGVAPYSEAEARDAGYARLLDIITQRQPEVVAEMQNRHRLFWSGFAGRTPVWFTVHAIMEHWNEWTITRMYWHRDFWEPDADSKKLKFEMRLFLAVYDEVKWSSLLDVQPQSTLDWIARLKLTCPAWMARKASVVDRWKQWQAFVAANPVPPHGDRARALNFDETLRLARHPRRGGWQPVTVRHTGEYDRQTGRRQVGKDGEDIYRKREGNQWGVQVRRWWEGLARRVVILTTEALPTVLAGRAGGWRIVELESPKMHRDTVEVVRCPLAAESVPLRIVEFRADIEEPDLWFISNNAEKVARTINHARAKGANHLAGRDLAQTMTHMNPDEWELMEVLNAWAGINTACRLRHVDEFNQSAGRNLGFRQQDGRKHWLLLSTELFLKVLPMLAEHSRYDLRIKLDKLTSCRLARAA